MGNNNTGDTIHEFNNECQKLLNQIEQQPDSSSLRITMEDAFTKILLLYAASHCEDLIHDIIIDLYRSGCSDKLALTEFVEHQALERRYHTMFNWEAGNANNFYGLFGRGFKQRMEKSIQNDSSLKDNAAAFVKLGRYRNKAIHENLATYSLEDINTNDVIRLYQQARQFVEKFSSEVHNYVSKENVPVTDD